MRARSQNSGSNERDDDYRNPYYLQWRWLFAEQHDTEPCSRHRLSVGQERDPHRSDHRDGKKNVIIANA
jgi:hypothetical protein